MKPTEQLETQWFMGREMKLNRVEERPESWYLEPPRLSSAQCLIRTYISTYISPYISQRGNKAVNDQHVVQSAEKDAPLQQQREKVAVMKCSDRAVL